MRATLGGGQRGQVFNQFLPRRTRFPEAALLGKDGRAPCHPRLRPWGRLAHRLDTAQRCIEIFRSDLQIYQLQNERGNLAKFSNTSLQHPHGLSAAATCSKGIGRFDYQIRLR